MINENENLKDIDEISRLADSTVSGTVINYPNEPLVLALKEMDNSEK